MPIKLGELLIVKGILTLEQVDGILEEQKRKGRPFGDLAERMYGVAASDIENAWAEQFSQLTEHVDPREEQIDPRVNDLVNRRQAWQFGILPLRSDGDEIVVATTREFLVRAIRFAGWSMPVPVYFVLCDSDLLEEALSTHYPFPGASLRGYRSAA